MRPERTPRTLRQIADACSFVLSVTEGKGPEDYSADRLLRQAVERNLEIVGEAVGRLRRDDPETAGRLSEHERIVGFRNVLIHGFTVGVSLWRRSVLALRLRDRRATAGCRVDDLSGIMEA